MDAYTRPEDLEIVRGLDVLELTQSEFKAVIDARNGTMTPAAHERLRIAAARQAAARKAATE